jgi:hypothetical protein
VADVTGFPEMMDGRVKTLHPMIHGGLLGLRDNPEHVAAMQKHGIKPIDLVCINLYPFEQTISKPNVTFDEAIENIDIGGPSMIRSAAKNHRFVLVVTSPERYEKVLGDLREHKGSTCGKHRLKTGSAGVCPHGRIRLADRQLPGQRQRGRFGRHGLEPAQGAGPSLRREPAPEGRVARRAKAARRGERRICETASRQGAQLHQPARCRRGAERGEGTDWADGLHREARHALWLRDSDRSADGISQRRTMPIRWPRSAASSR